MTNRVGIIGLGANDAKGCIAAMLCALHRVSRTDLPGEVVLALTVDEEIEEVNEGLELLIGDLGRLDAAVIGEPTDLAICRAQKGRMVLEVEMSGLARHAAHAHRIHGGNAVVEAARAMGTQDRIILFRHILPNVMVPIIVNATLFLGMAIIFAAGLGFLGIGVQPPAPEWGTMLGAGRSLLFAAPHVATFPGIAIFLAVLSFNLLGDGLRDALDPKDR